MKLALNGCSYLQSPVRLSFQRHRTYNPHPCTVLTAAHNTHTRPPDAPARLPYQRTLMNSYCMFDLADLASAPALGAPSRSHAAGPASISLVSDAETCPTRKTLRPLKRPVVAPILAELALVATMMQPCLEQTRFYSSGGPWLGSLHCQEARRFPSSHLPPLSAPRHTIQVAAHAWRAWTGSCHC